MRHAIAALLLAFMTMPALAGNGIASVYGNGDGYAWKKTASGERMDPNAMTAAHKTLRFGTVVNVCRDGAGRCATVRINDRGPFVAGRIIDLSPVAMRALGCNGLCRVTVEVVR